MKKIGISAIIMLLAANIVSAVGIFDILNETFIENMADLPGSQGIPEKNIQSSGHIKGWIDIVGFSKMMREDGIDYVPGSPEDYAIVQYDAWAELGCGGCSLESLTTNVVVSSSGNQTVAEISVKLKYSRTICSGGGGNGASCTTSYYSESAIFRDFEISPQIYSIRIENLTALITEYNNSISPKTSVGIDIPSYLSILRYQYGDNITEYHARFAMVEKTAKGILFANISRSHIWEIKGDGMGRIGDNVIIKQVNVSYPDLNITAYTLYENKTITSYNISGIDYIPEKTWNPFLFYFVGLLAIFTVGTLKLSRRILRW